MPILLLTGKVFSAEIPQYPAPTQARTPRMEAAMKALVLKEKNKLAIEDFSIDEPLTPDDVRITDHTRRDLRQRRPLLSARSDRRLRGQRAHGARPRSQRNRGRDRQERHSPESRRPCLHGARHSFGGERRHPCRLLQPRPGGQVLGHPSRPRLHAGNRGSSRRLHIQAP